MRGKILALSALFSGSLIILSCGGGGGSISFQESLPQMTPERKCVCVAVCVFWDKYIVALVKNINI